MFALLGKPGYEDRKAELEAALKESRNYAHCALTNIRR